MTAALWSQWQSDRVAATERAAHEARILASEVDDHISALQNLLSVLVKAVSYDPADRSANDALLRKVQEELSGFDSHIFLFDVDGNNIGTSARSDYPPPNAHDRTYFREALTDHVPAVGDPIQVRSGHWIVNVARPVKDETGKIRAVLTVGPVLDHFQDTLRLHGLPPGTAISIINSRGFVLAANGGDWIGRRRTDWKQLPARFAAKEGSDTSQWSHRDNIERVNGFALARRVPWMVTVGVPTDIAYGALATRLKWGALMCGGTLAIAFAIAWLLSGRIVRPLRRLGMDAAVLAGGDLSHRTAVDGRDEVGTLANNFNQMAAALELRRQKVRTARGEMRQAKDTLATVIDTSHVAIVCCDSDQSVVLWSRGAERMFGYGADEALGRQRMLVPPEGMTETLALFRRAYGGETIRDLHVKRRRKDGALLDVRLAAAPMYNPDGTVRSVAFAYEDITDRKAAEEQLRRLAHYDQLTGLPNRALLQQELRRLLAKDGGKAPTSIVLFDLDEFKDVNDTLGHSTGDQLLIEVGRRLMGVAEERSVVGLASRLGGDEFVVILPNCGDPRSVSEVVNLMLKRLNEPFVINDQVVHLGASAGVAIAPQDGADVEELIANADLALYQAKSEGGRNLRFFMPVLRAQAQARRSLGLELRRAFTNNEFEIYFQPQIRLFDNAVVGAEALLRWRHPQRGVLGPGAFIDTLAESAIASGVGRWIIRTACEQSAAWRAMGLPLARVGVNLFPSQAYDEALFQDVMEALRDFALPADALELEITENIALNPEDSAVLQRLHDGGVKLAFDDFGTGYASLSYLTRLPLSRIKIDRSFVGKITHDAHDAAIVRSLIAMAHNLDIGVIAEGVETLEQASFLLNEDCEEAQGFLYAKPLPAPEFEAYLRTQRLALQVEGGLEPGGTEPVRFERRGTKSPGRRKARRA